MNLARLVVGRVVGGLAVGGLGTAAVGAAWHRPDVNPAPDSAQESGVEPKLHATGFDDENWTLRWARAVIIPATLLGTKLFMNVFNTVEVIHPEKIHPFMTARNPDQ